MDWEIGQTNPNWDRLRDVQSRIKIRRPSIKLQILSPHEIGVTPEDKITVFFRYKFEDEEASAYSITSHAVLEPRSPILLDPVISGSY